MRHHKNISCESIVCKVDPANIYLFKFNNRNTIKRC